MSPRPNCAVPDCPNLVEVERKGGAEYHRRVCAGHRKHAARANRIERRTSEPRTWLEEFEWGEYERKRERQVRSPEADDYAMEREQARLREQDRAVAAHVPAYEAWRAAVILHELKRRFNERTSARVVTTPEGRTIDREKLSRALAALGAAYDEERFPGFCMCWKHGRPSFVREKGQIHCLKCVRPLVPPRSWR